MSSFKPDTWYQMDVWQRKCQTSYKGASLRSAFSGDSEPLPKGCWCLCDGNIDVAFPCENFMRSELRIFLVTSASLESYRKWRNQTDATTVVKALPRTMEMAAIAWVPCYLPICCSAFSQKNAWLSAVWCRFSITKVWPEYPHHLCHPRKDTKKPTYSVFERTLTWLQKSLHLL